MDKRFTGLQFRFRKNDTIGNAEAESDEVFLRDCFLDTGELEILRDLNDSKRIIVGRTGSGKSALIQTLCEREENVIELRPENLSLSYLSNSAVLKFFEDAGTSLEVFYQLLWKHVLAVELIKRRYHITNEQSQNSFLAILSNVFTRDRTKEKAISYLRDWGECFWNETETRVREVTTKIENELRAAISGTAVGAKLEAGGTEKLTAEEKKDVVQRGAKAVSQLQLSALSNLLKLLEEEIFNDDQISYFVVIDDLDTKWVDDGLKFKLIRALIETVKSFRQVRRVKVIVALRLDLLQRVVSATKDSGFQSEKYESMYLRLRWTAPQLIELVSKRLARLVKQRYTSKIIPLEDLFPKQMHKHESFTDYLCDRTSLRPRDAILFVNECLSRATDRQQISVQLIQDAEASYSEKRILSLAEEWGGVYPLISEYIKILQRRPMSFQVGDLGRNTLDSWIYSNLLEDLDVSDPVADVARLYVDNKADFNDVVLVLLDALYTVGMIGIRTDSGMQAHWSHFAEHKPAPGSIKNASTVLIHPTFWRGLGVKIQ